MRAGAVVASAFAHIASLGVTLLQFIRVQNGSGRIGKGSSVIRYILCECANSAWKTKSSLAAKYKSLMVRKTHKKAIVALAHKIIRLIYVMLTRKVAYHDPQIDYEAMSAKKNAPRWIKQLKMIGKWPGAGPLPASS